jgi:hypothetical protein
MQTNLYIVIKNEKKTHKRSKIRLWNKIVLWTNVEQTKSNDGFYFYLYPFGDLIKKNSNENFHMFIYKKKFLRNFLITNGMQINYK